MAADAPVAPFTMLGAPEAAACEDDACLIAGTSAEPSAAQPAPAPLAE